MAYSMAHLAAGSLCLLEPSGYARAGSGVTTSVSALGIGSWVSIRTTYPERRGHGRPPPLPPPRPPFAYCQSSFFFRHRHPLLLPADDISLRCARKNSRCASVFGAFRRPPPKRPRMSTVKSMRGKSGCLVIRVAPARNALARPPCQPQSRRSG